MSVQCNLGSFSVVLTALFVFGCAPPGPEGTWVMTGDRHVMGLLEEPLVGIYEGGWSGALTEEPDTYQELELHPDGRFRETRRRTWDERWPDRDGCVQVEDRVGTWSRTEALVLTLVDTDSTAHQSDCPSAADDYDRVLDLETRTYEAWDFIDAEGGYGARGPEFGGITLIRESPTYEEMELVRADAFDDQLEMRVLEDGRFEVNGTRTYPEEGPLGGCTEVYALEARYTVSDAPDELERFDFRVAAGGPLEITRSGCADPGLDGTLSIEEPLARGAFRFASGFAHVGGGPSIDFTVNETHTTRYPLGVP